MEFTPASPRLLSDAFNTWPDCLLGSCPHAGLLRSGMKGRESSYQEKYGNSLREAGRCSRRTVPLALLSAPHLLLWMSFPLSLGQELTVFGIRLVAAASHLSLINFTFTDHQVLLTLRSLV